MFIKTVWVEKLFHGTEVANNMKQILTLLIVLALAHTAIGRTWQADSKNPDKSIQATINRAAPGDTIIVLPGVYREKLITVNKQLYLLGKDFPVLDGESKHEILLIEADGVVVQGFRIENSGSSGYLDIAAVKVMGVRNVIVRGNRINNTFFAIYIQRAVNCIIAENEISSHAKMEAKSANGIHCWKSDSLSILNNRITGHRDGIYFEFVTNSLIKGNRSFNNLRYGLHFMFSHSDTYIDNVFTNNGAGVAVMYTRKVRMLNNTFSENWGSSSYGILLKDISDSDIEGNVFLNNTSGIHMEGSSRILITRNTFRQNGWGLKIQASCDDNVIRQNNFFSNTFDVATNGSNSLNEFDANYWDKYEGYDLNRDGVGDVPFRPVSLYSMIVERNPSTMMLFRSFMVTLLDKAEKVIPSITPLNLVDNKPRMKPERL